MSLWISFPLNLGAAYMFTFPSSWPGQMLELPPTVDPIYAGLCALMVALFGFAYAWFWLLLGQAPDTAIEESDLP